MNESKRLTDVWEWKEKVYEETRNMKRSERIGFFKKGLEDFEKRTGIKLREIAPKKAAIG